MMKRALAAFGAILLMGAPAALAQPVLNSAIAPNARNGATNTPLTVFASVINSGNQTATDCRVLDRVTSTLTTEWRTLNADNTLDGTPGNEPFTIAPGQTRNLLLTFRSTADHTNTRIDVVCGNGRTTSFFALNTVTIRDDGATAVDIIPIVVTASGDSVIRIADVGGVGFMAAAAINIGGPGPVRVRPSFSTWPHAPVNGSAALPLAPVALTICETGSNGACLAPPTSDSLTVDFATNQTRTFTVFTDAHEGSGLPFMPDINRVFISFESVFTSQYGWSQAGMSSAAIVSPAPAGVTSPAGVYNLWMSRVDEDRRGTFTEVEFPMVAMISPSGLFAAYGAEFAERLGQRFNSVYALENLFGQLAFGSISGGEVPFTSSDLRANSIYPSPTAPGYAGVISASGTIRPGEKLMGSYSQTTTATANRYNRATNMRGALMSDIYDRPVSLASVGGKSYSLRAPNDVVRGSVSVSTSGSLTGTYENCDFTGALTQPTAGKNLFEVRFNFATCPNQWSTRTFTGLATSPPELGLSWRDSVSASRTVLANPLVSVVSTVGGGAGTLVWSPN